MDKKLNQLYQSTILKHGHAPRNFGKPEKYQRFAEGFNPLCGDKVDIYWTKYKLETDEDLLQYYKGQTLEAEDLMIRKNSALTTMFRAAAAIHVVNMIDAYLIDITPEPLGKKTSLGLGYDPIINQPQLRLSIALD